MRKLIRSNSDSKFFFEKESLNLISLNINKLKLTKKLIVKENLEKSSNHLFIKKTLTK